jgi:hypothetical protein
LFSSPFNKSNTIVSSFFNEPNKVVCAKTQKVPANKVAAIKVPSPLPALLVLMNNDDAEANILLLHIDWVIDCLVGMETRTML